MPTWRDQARAKPGTTSSPHSYLHDPDALFLRESESGYGPIGVTLADYMAQTGINHASDATGAMGARTTGRSSVILKRSWEKNEEILEKLLVDTHSLANVSDAGAHGKLFCGAGYNVFLLTDYVRDRKIISIEQGVHMLTWRLAEFFGLHDRGLIEVGKAADITVFDLDEIEMRPEKKTWDVWDGTGGRTYRYTRDPAPMRLTLVNGEPTFDRGEFTGRYPGRFGGPEEFAELALAAEYSAANKSLSCKGSNLAHHPRRLARGAELEASGGLAKRDRMIRRVQRAAGLRRPLCDIAHKAHRGEPVQGRREGEHCRHQQQGDAQGTCAHLGLKRVGDPARNQRSEPAEHGRREQQQRRGRGARCDGARRWIEATTGAM